MTCWIKFIIYLVKQDPETISGTWGELYCVAGAFGSLLSCVELYSVLLLFHAVYLFSNLSRDCRCVLAYAIIWYGASSGDIYVYRNINNIHIIIIINNIKITDD